MGCTQAKHSTNSPPRGLQKLKMENGYVKAKYPDARRSTGQRYAGVPKPEARNSSAGNSGRLVGGGGKDGNLITREAKKDSGGSGDGNILKRMASLNLGGEEELVDGWPKWLTDNIPKDVLAGIVPRSAESYEKLDKVGQGTYSNVYKARDRNTGKIVALKKVRFDTSEPESVKFMAREIVIMQKLDHPNILKLEGLATSRMQYSLYLVFDYMQSDLARIISRPDERLTEPQIKCYMHQLLAGLQHCHDRGILHRDIKGSNLLIDKNGMLKIGDFGLAHYFDPTRKHRLTSRVVTLWYRAPELLLGATDYGVGIDLWSAGCLMAEMFVGRPIMPGRTEVEQLHRIFKLCGTPSEEYWKKVKASPTFKPPHAYKSNFREVFRAFPSSSLGLLNTLLALDPTYRGSASSALRNEFFCTSPLACDLSGLPVIYKEEDEPMQTSERRRHRNPKMRRRSRTLQERQKKDLAEVAMEQPKGDFGSAKEEAEKIVGLNLQQGSSSTSASSSIKHTIQEGTPRLSLSSNESCQKNMSPSSKAHPNATNNIKNLPPLPNAKTRIAKYNGDGDDRYTFSQIQRSTSTREFRKLDQRKFHKLHAVDD
ncbi:Serine/threonine-protein kinase [Actinidia chinensis var. chinensis]|uniref:Serine/threonine-protein kinase n=1 Tax=Actinidia chinensis var. chinensis TaxID=1590841 RepID=A0A2R6RNU4_ACTCC|nr:Serine/threonine-protein kinase [Actinidia chinensis var. chinensis]